MATATVVIYLKGGTVHQYDIAAEHEEQLGPKAREHCYAIISGGFRANSGNGDFTWFGPHWVDKVKVENCNVATKYSTTPTGT